MIKQIGHQILYPDKLYQEVYKYQFEHYNFSKNQAKWLLYAIYFAEHLATTGQVRTTFPRYYVDDRDSFVDTFNKHFEKLQNYSYGHLPNQNTAALRNLATEIKDELRRSKETCH